MDRTDTLTHALRLLNEADLAALSRSATWHIAHTGSAGPQCPAPWNEAMIEIIHDEEQRRRGATGAALDADRQLRIAATALTERELALLLGEFQAKIDDVEAHWGRTYARYLIALRNALRRQLILPRESEQ